MARSPKRWLWVAAGLAVAFLIGGGIVWSQQAPVGASTPTAALGQGVDDVMLVSDAGENIRWGDLKGRPRAVFFGFTHCPVICPVTVWELNDALEKLGPQAQQVQIEFVTIDPERDDPSRLHDYFSGFDGHVRAFTGSPEAIARVADAFEIVYERQAGEGADYTMDHTATVFLLDAQGHVRDVVGYGSPPEVMQSRLSALIEG